MPQEQRDFRYRVVNITTTAPFSEQHYPMDGEVLAYMGPINGPDLYFRINELTADRILLTPNSRYVGKVREFWLDLDTVAAGITSVQLYVASEAGHLIESQQIRVASTEHTPTLITDVIELGAATAALQVSASANRQRLTLKNIGSASCWIGNDNTVDEDTGYMLDPGEQVTISNYTGNVYAYSTIGTWLNVLQEGN